MDVCVALFALLLVFVEQFLLHVNVCECVCVYIYSFIHSFFYIYSFLLPYHLPFIQPLSLSPSPTLSTCSNPSQLKRRTPAGRTTTECTCTLLTSPTPHTHPTPPTPHMQCTATSTLNSPLLTLAMETSLRTPQTALPFHTPPTMQLLLRSWWPPPAPDGVCSEREGVLRTYGMRTCTCMSI